MKILIIGRSENCHIQVDNAMVSRQHAVLKVYSLGKMIIRDQSKNGTAINGVPLVPGRDYPVKRTDVVTFAGTTQLDWAVVPDPLRSIKFFGIPLLVIIGIVAVFFSVRKCHSDEPEVIDTLPYEEGTIQNGESSELNSDSKADVDLEKALGSMKSEEERNKQASQRAKQRGTKKDTVGTQAPPKEPVEEKAEEKEPEKRTDVQIFM